MQFLGLGKTKYNSSVALIETDDQKIHCEILLTERINRKKNSGEWPHLALSKIYRKLNFSELLVAENRDVLLPAIVEEKENEKFPFYEFLGKKKLLPFTSRHNPKLKFVNHHMAHAYAALACSPFTHSIILIIDGAGSQVGENSFEELSVFLQQEGTLTLIHQRQVNFTSIYKHTFGNQIGSSYEKMAEYIFNSPNASGKVMGLAPFGRPDMIDDLLSFQLKLNWEESFSSTKKEEWERSNITHFQNLAASIQNKFEIEMFNIVNAIKRAHPQIDNLIISGGCALNCTFNAKLYYKKLFDHIYVLPFPGDESIGLGLAYHLGMNEGKIKWCTSDLEKQNSYFGSFDSVPDDQEIERIFSHSDFYKIQKSNNITEVASELLVHNHVIAWFQGRSECGPRALGNRSILARPDLTGLKNYLNGRIKFRENFRPYGCSVLFEKSHLYFDVSERFQNPFMSFAVKVRPEYIDVLCEVTHVDGTSRMQTVQRTQNSLFYDLIKKFGEKTNIFCLLNTSLNIMDEPILESIADAERFFKSSEIKYLVIGNYLISKRSNEK